MPKKKRIETQWHVYQERENGTWMFVASYLDRQRAIDHAQSLSVRSHKRTMMKEEYVRV